MQLGLTTSLTDLVHGLTLFLCSKLLQQHKTWSSLIFLIDAREFGQQKQEFKYLP